MSADAKSEGSEPVKIEQKLGFQKRTASIGSDGVEVTFSGIITREKWKIRFEELLRDPVEFTQQPEKMPVPRAVVFGLGLYFAFATFAQTDIDKAGGFLVTTLCLGSVALASLLDRLPRRQLLQLSSSSPPCLLFADRPDREAVAKFSDALFTAAAAYFATNYPKENSGLDIVEQLERLNALKSNGAITEKEYDQLKTRLIGTSTDYRSGDYL